MMRMPGGMQSKPKRPSPTRMRSVKRRNEMNIKTIESLANRDDLIEVGRKAIEDILVEWRDSGLSTLGRGNGFKHYSVRA